MKAKNQIQTAFDNACQVKREASLTPEEMAIINNYSNGARAGDMALVSRVLDKPTSGELAQWANSSLGRACLSSMFPDAGKLGSVSTSRKAERKARAKAFVESVRFHAPLIAFDDVKANEARAGVNRARQSVLNARFAVAKEAFEAGKDDEAGPVVYDRAPVCDTSTGFLSMQAQGDLVASFVNGVAIQSATRAIRMHAQGWSKVHKEDDKRAVPVVAMENGRALGVSATGFERFETDGPTLWRGRAQAANQASQDEALGDSIAAISGELMRLANAGPVRAGFVGPCLPDWPKVVRLLVKPVSYAGTGELIATGWGQDWFTGACSMVIDRPVFLRRSHLWSTGFKSALKSLSALPGGMTGRKVGGVIVMGGDCLSQDWSTHRATTGQAKTDIDWTRYTGQLPDDNGHGTCEVDLQDGSAHYDFNRAFQKDIKAARALAFRKVVCAGPWGFVHTLGASTPQAQSGYMASVRRWRVLVLILDGCAVSEAVERSGLGQSFLARSERGLGELVAKFGLQPNALGAMRS